MRSVSPTRLIRNGFILVGVGVLLTVVKIAFDVRSVGDWNFWFTIAGVALTGIGARRRRAAWAPPRQEDRFPR